MSLHALRQALSVCPLGLVGAARTQELSLVESKGGRRFPEHHDVLFTKPNKQRQARIGRQSEKGSVLVAMGAGHLSVQKSLIERLRSKGYQFVRINN